MPFITCGDIEIYYEQTGHGPTLTLIHGLGTDVRLWAPIVQRLKNNFTVLAFDTRGSGKTAKPEEAYTIGQMAGDAATFMEQICGKAVRVLGFSMGGTVAMELAISRPELVERLALVSTPPSWNGPFPPPEHTRELFRRTDVSPELLTEVYETIFGSEYRKRTPAQGYIDLRLNDENPQPLYAYLNQLHALETHELNKNIPSISAPTLIVAGNEDKVVPPQNASWLKENIPGARLKLFEGAGHMIPVEMPDRLAAEILNDLQ
jgi:3-oxoadipate enol-lactonase